MASAHGLYLKGLGGSCQGVIGAVAAVGLIHAGQDGRVVQLGEWPDDLSGPTLVSAVRARGVRLRDETTGRDAAADFQRVNVGKHLRPNVRDHEYVLFVRPAADEELFEWSAVKRV